MKKRILSVLLAIALVVSAVVVTAFAAVNHTGIKTPAVVYGDTYPAQTISVDGSSATLPITLTGNIEVSDVGADYITFSQIADNSETVLVKLAGTKIYYAQVTEGTTGAYTEVSVSANNMTDGTYTISNLEEGATYSIKVLSGTLSTTYAGDTLRYRNFVESDAIEVQTISYVDAGKWPVPEGLGTDEGKLTGTVSGKVYQYVKLSAPEFAIDEASYADYDAASTVLTGGLYAVRIKAGVEGTNKYQNSDAAIVWVKGANAGTLTLSSVSASDFTSGNWTFLSALGNMNPAIKANFGVQWYMDIGSQDKYNAGTYAYQMTDDEIIAVSDLFGFSFKKQNNQGDHVKTIDPDGGEANVTGAVIFHIFGADKDIVKVPFIWKTAATTSVNIDFAAAAAEQLSSMEGYIYRIEIDLIYLEEGQTMADVNLRASREGVYEGVNYDELKGSAGAGAYTYQEILFADFADGRIKLNALVPAATPVLSVEGTETEGTYRILGLDATKNYAISNDGVTYNDVPAGSSYVDVTSAGTYYIYVKATDTTLESEVATITFDGAMPAIPEGTLYYDEATATIKGFDDQAHKTTTGVGTVVLFDWGRVSADGTITWVVQDENDKLTTDKDSFSASAGHYAFRYASRGTKVAGVATYIVVLATEPIPELSATGTETEGIFRIHGLDATKNYAISTDGVSYNDIPAGSSYVDVTATGTYYIYTKATETSYASAATSISISGAMPAIPEGTLYYVKEEAAIKGFDAEANFTATGTATDATISYQWCKVSGDGTLLWDQSTNSTAGSIPATPGYYAFRYTAKGTKVPGAPTYIFVYEGGSKKGTVSSAVAPSNERTNDFTVGYWTMSATAFTSSKAYNEGANRRLACAYTTRLEDITDLAWQYQFTDEEVFPLSELSGFKFQIGFANGKRYNADYYGKVRVFVAGGDAAYYDVPFVIGHNTMSIVNVSDIWEDEVELDANFMPKGYVTAVAIYYYTEEGIQGVSVTTANDYAVATLGGHDSATMRASQFIALKSVVDISTIEAVPAVGTYGGEIIGLNPEAVYQIADYDESTQTLGEWSFLPIGTYVNKPAGTYAIRSYSDATNPKFLTSDYVIVTIDPAPVGDQRESAKVDKIILPEEVKLSEANYIFDINESRWINRLALSNIVKESPNANVIFQADTYRFTIAASDIDLSLDTAHYFDMKVTFDGESAYDRMYSKMTELADEKELVKGIHFESTTEYFFEKATFDLFLGEKYDGYDVELRSYNERVNRLRNEETVTVDGGWASFTTFGGDYLILCPAMAEE